ncbi:MAG: four helix bundle protein [Gemmatimonadota bacterium]
MDPQSDPLSYRQRMSDLQARTKQRALRIVRLCANLGGKPEARVIRGQLLRSAMSFAANYRAVCRARSRKEFVAKLGVTIEELDESQFWIEFATDARLIRQKRVGALRAELEELLAILNASRATARKRLGESGHSSNR